MLRQFQEIKANYQDAVLFFRLGDFYEMFLEDAKIASRELELTLTGRGKDENRIPMCGVPYHAAENYIAKLVNRGYKVAICEQVEDPATAKGLTRREVIKVITPGTVLTSGSLEETDSNYLAAVAEAGKDRYGVSVMDISTGEFKLFIAPDKTRLINDLSRLAPKELLIADTIEGPVPDAVRAEQFTPLPFRQAEQRLADHFKVASLNAFGLEDLRDAFPSAWAALDYALKTQKHSLPQVTRLLPLQNTGSLLMDRVTMKNLELTESLNSGQDRSGTLFGILNHCQTAMGARYLKHCLKNPFTEPEKINHRLDAVEELLKDLLSREELKETLACVYDLERLISRIASDHNNPRDCLALCQSLEVLPDITAILSHFDSAILKDHYHFFSRLDQDNASKETETGTIYQKISRLIRESIREDAPPTVREGNMIKPEYNNELKDLLASFRSIKEWIATLEQKERAATGIKSLKLGFNKVFGYYIEIPQSQQKSAPQHYIRKQTLANAERYITPELKEKETILLNGEEKQKEVELRIFLSVTAEIKQAIPALQELARRIAELDVLQSLATAAQKNRYCRPVIETGKSHYLHIRNGRHPVLEKNPDIRFVPNTVTMDKDKNRFILITGPNMAGKSTIMRQTALIVVMAQIGSFVPADFTALSVVDKLFTRIGALDNLYSGQSTFMVEMLETATILNNATQDSLIILDEVGRGTSTFDGLSIAYAICEFIHGRIGARTLFATHYHELTVLAEKLEAFGNFSMKITEADNTIVFNHELIPGPADKSYGVHVAKMAGLPDSVITLATTLLNKFEVHGSTYLQDKASSRQMRLF